jgi:tetratricopeptide (TPR) repeat protein
VSPASLIVTKSCSCISLFSSKTVSVIFSFLRRVVIISTMAWGDKTDDKAIEFYEKALKIIKDIGNREKESSCYENLGGTYDTLGQYEKAIEFYEKALKIKKDIGDKKGESNCYLNLGNTYRQLSQYGKAIRFINKALRIKKDIKAREEELYCYGNLAKNYDKLGSHSYVCNANIPFLSFCQVTMH